MKGLFPWLIVICVGIVSFTAGYLAGDSSNARSANLERFTANPTGGEGERYGKSDPTKSADESGGLTSQQTRNLTFELLSEPNRVTRMHRLCEMLSHVTVDNWRGAVDAFGVQTKTEGRWQLDEWHLMIERVGEVAGPEALAEALQTGAPSDLYRAQRLLTGFAAGDPKAAIEWFQKQPPEQQQQLFNNLLSGLGRSDPKRAIQFILDQPQKVWEPNATSIITGAIQFGGFRAADGLLASIRDRSDVPDLLKGKVLYDLVKHQITIHADPLKMLDWLEPNLPIAGPNAMKESIAVAARADPAKTLAWLEERADRIGPVQAPAAYATIAGILQMQAPEQLAAWMNANPSHPQHDLMAQVAANALLESGRLDEARKWREAIRDPNVRAQLEKSISASEALRKRSQQSPPR